MIQKNICCSLLYVAAISVLDAQVIIPDRLPIALQENSKIKVLIVSDEVNESVKPSSFEVIELSNLLGHFRTTVTVCDTKQYRARELNKHDVVFYLGNTREICTSREFMNDVWQTRKTVVWMNGGIPSFSKAYNLDKKFGFSVSASDSSGTYNQVICKGIKYRIARNIFLIQISNTLKVKQIATAYADRLQKEIPYIVKSGNFYYIADMPLLHVSPSDRYLLFADLLHDFIGENHPESHQAIVRIEDVTPLRNPQNLRNIADILAERHIPFLIGVVPFYVNPLEQMRVSLSDRPEIVKAILYCVEKGATVVLHGITHQYKGETAIDFEFWDGSVLKPIVNENTAQIENKMEEGIEECLKNGIYPLIWETPHYAASMKDYAIFSAYFSSAIERRLLLDDYKCGQYFPYIIQKDSYGQKVYPENLGYIPLLRKDSTEMFINRMINNAQTLYNVRDGFASFFFHSFINNDYLKEVVDRISALGFSFIDLRLQPNQVRTKDVIILSGSQTYSINLDHSFLYEVYYNKDGSIEKKVMSKKPVTGMITKKVLLKPDEFYLAEPLKNPSTANKI